MKNAITWSKGRLEWTSIDKMAFKTANAFLEYDGLSFEILYRGDHFDEEAYRDIFQKLQKEHYFDFHIEYRRFSDH